MPALGRLLAAGRELSALLEALEDIAVLGGAELLRGQAGALSAALAATLRGVNEAICAPQPVTAASAAGMPKGLCKRAAAGVKVCIRRQAFGTRHTRCRTSNA